MVGKPESTLAKNADIVLDVGVKKEACPLGLAPTSSTTATLAFGDALAMELLSARHLRKSVAIYHRRKPGQEAAPYGWGYHAQRG